MKKLISLVLVLVLCLSLAACGKEPTLEDLLQCPVGADLDELEKFLKDCGYEIENTSDSAISFTHGSWDGLASTQAIMLSMNSDATQDDIDAMREEIQAICGDPYNENTSNGYGMTSTKEFYTDGNSVIVLDISEGIMSSVRVVIYPGAANNS